MVLVANRIVTIGEDDLTATGQVVITRGDIRASGNEATLASDGEVLDLRRNAVIRNDEYKLAGEAIHAILVEGALEYVQATTEARMVSDRVNVTAPDLQLFFSDERLEQVVARTDALFGEGRARAASPDFSMVADSIDAIFREQRLHEVHAIGSARAESVAANDSADPADLASANEPDGSVAGPEAGVTDPSSLDPELAVLSDWIIGDTIIGYFERPSDAEGADREDPEGAGAGESNLHRLRAIGSAQSLYRLAGESDADAPRADLNFLVGDEIDLELREGRLEVAKVAGLRRGVYLEANPGAQRAPEISNPPLPETMEGAAPDAG